MTRPPPSPDDSTTPAQIDPGDKTTVEPTGNAQSPRPNVPGYELHEKGGQGAMGVVWRATQLSTKRKVALKLLPDTWLESEEMRRRFEREIEIAARLEHPRIARVYDSGIREGGYYYAMQWIEGHPLDKHVEKTAPGTLELLRLFTKVCDAVQYAHVNGVIHRDLKPSNILVSEEGQPFVVDFGLAKPVGEDRSLSTDGNVAGTPHYMSPEQARGDIMSLDTRTDVYSLGVILYKLLTGHLPHDADGGLITILLAVAEKDPIRPSRYVSSLSGDLEAVLLKALAKVRENRYATAGEFGNDLDRFLDRMPVTARPITAGYLAQVWLRRHRVGVAVASVFAIVLAVGAIASVQRILKERDRAQANFEIARGGIHEFFMNLGDRAFDDQPGMARLRRMLLQNARDYYEKLIEKEPDNLDLKAEYSRSLTVLSQQEFDLGLTSEASKHLQQGMDLQVEVLVKRPEEDWIRMMLAQGHDRLATQAIESGELNMAQEHVDQALALKKDLCDRNPDNSQYLQMQAFSFRLAARLARRRGLPSEAKAWDQRAFSINEQLLREEPDDTETMLILARQWSDRARELRDSMGNVKEALELERKALALKQQLAERDPEDTGNQLSLAYSNSELAKSFAAQGDLLSARETEMAAANLKRILCNKEPNNPKPVRALIYSLHQLVQYCAASGDLNAANVFLEEARNRVALYQQLTQDPVRTTKTASFHHNMRGLLALRDGRYAESAEEYRRAEEMLSSQFGELPGDVDIRTMLLCVRLFRLDASLETGEAPGFEQQVDRIEELLKSWDEITPQIVYYEARLWALRGRHARMAGDDGSAAIQLGEARHRLERLRNEGVSLPDDPNRALAFAVLGEDSPLAYWDQIETDSAPLASLPTPVVNQEVTIPDTTTAFSAVDADALLRAIGRECVVTGTVHACSWNRKETHFFVDFAERGTGFYGLIREQQYPDFRNVLGDDPATTLPGNRVVIQGKIAEHRGRPQIILVWPRQFRVIERADASKTTALPEDAPLIPWQDSSRYIDQVVAVTGTVVRTENIGRMCFLDFEAGAESANTFHLPVMQSTYDDWPEPPETYFQGKEIKVVGKVVLYRGAPQITIERSEQVKITGRE